MKAVSDTNVLIDFFRNPSHREEFEAKKLPPHQHPPVTEST
jgi:hypothetical protein